MRKILLFLTAIGLLLAVGCSTPAARIERDPEAFNRLDPADQQLIRDGKVGIGFTAEMVKLALGDPDRVFSRTDATGTNETWSYTTYEGSDGHLLYRGYYHRYYGFGDPFFPYYLSYPSRREREYFKVVFTGGTVSAIEQQT